MIISGINKFKLLGMPLRNIIGWAIWEGRPTWTQDPTFWWQPTLKGLEERNFWFFPLPSLTGRFIYPAAEAILHQYENFFRIPMSTEDEQPSQNPPGLQGQIQMTETSSRVTIHGFSAFPSGDRYCWAARPQPVNPSNKFPFLQNLQVYMHIYIYIYFIYLIYIYLIYSSSPAPLETRLIF